ncbi:MAG: 2-dehydropantoate 2-reductase [Chthoniobacteraceae bacterium]
MNRSLLGKIAVVGSGAVGCYYGGMLVHAGHDVHFLMRADFAVVRRDGLRIFTKGNDMRLPRVQCAATTEEIGPVDLVIISVKATANAGLVRLLPPLIGERTALLTLQNGLGNERFLSDRWGAERVMGGLCFVCINRTAPGVIRHIDHGSISIGEFLRPLSARARAVAEAFNAVDVEANAVDDLEGERWRKLLWNIPFNGFSIAANANVAEVLGDATLRAEARALMDELLDAARRLGHEILDSFADWQIERSDSMGAYKPSSMIDYELGRRVEVEAIWGEPLRQGLAAGAKMPRLALLHGIIRHVTERRALRGA